MKLEVISPFMDKHSHEVYSVGTLINIDDKERCADIIGRGLAKSLVPEPSAVTQPEPQTEVLPDAESEDVAIEEPAPRKRKNARKDTLDLE